MIPAFPKTTVPWQDGMTLRDYFAAKALPEIIRQAALVDEVPDSDLARQAYLMADAMLKARE